MLKSPKDKRRSTTGHVQSLAEVTLGQVLPRIAALARVAPEHWARSVTVGGDRWVRDLCVAAEHVVVLPRHYVMAGAAVFARLSSAPVS